METPHFQGSAVDRFSKLSDEFDGRIIQHYDQKMMSKYSNVTIAGIGVAKKMDMLSCVIATGMS